MPKLFWTGKLTPPMLLLVNANNLLAWMNGNARDAASMKTRVMQGYDGDFSDHVTRYDELGSAFQEKAAAAQLEGIDLRGKKVLDVGGGTGIISLLALQKGAASVVCSDISRTMLDMGREKAARLGCAPDRIEFRQDDMQSLPYADGTYDVVLTGMTLGLVPDQGQAVSEMARVLRPGGLISVGAHGFEHYWEAVDASFRAIDKRYVLGYRLEFWPQSEREVRRLVEQTGMLDIQVKRFTWRNKFNTGGEGYDFFSAITGNWWYARVPVDKREALDKKTRDYFDRRGVTTITDDIVIASGRKPLEG
jgi:ubiquinone/menaquinone biosynthesis C-methylase UbiE